MVEEGLVKKLTPEQIIATAKKRNCFTYLIPFTVFQTIYFLEYGYSKKQCRDYSIKAEREFYKTHLETEYSVYRDIGAGHKIRKELKESKLIEFAQVAYDSVLQRKAKMDARKQRGIERRIKRAKKPGKASKKYWPFSYT